MEVLLGSTVTAPSPGLLTYGASTVTAQDYASAAQADGISVTRPPGAAPSGGSVGGTQSVSSAILGARSAISGATSSTPTPQPSTSTASGGGIGAGAVTVAPNARYGIPCVY